jgi:magnesium transporter
VTRDGAQPLDPDIERQTAEALEDFALGDDYALNPEFVEMVVDAADRGDGMRLRELMGALRPADVADLMGFLTEAHRNEVIPWLPPDTLGEVLPELDDRIREQVIERLRPADLAEALQELDSDDAAAVIEDLEEDKRGAVLAAMPEQDRTAIETTLAYGEDTAGRLMQREVVAAPPFWTVDRALTHLREHDGDLPELFFEIYVTDPSHKPVGVTSISRVLRSRGDVTLSHIMEPVTEIPIGMDQEEVAYIFEKYHLISAPVVDDGGRLVGQITVDDIVNIIQQENREDILALAGVSDAGRDAGVFGMARSRFWWLLINLGTAILASGVISIFQGSIAKLVALAVLNPIAASMGGNAGTQTLTVAVRALATNELNAANLLRTVWRETAVGLLNGVAFALVMGLVALVWFHDPMLALVTALAMMLNLIVAALAGILIPVLLDRWGFDPASSAVVFLTTVTDCVGFFSFLGLATVMLLR